MEPISTLARRGGFRVPSCRAKEFARLGIGLAVLLLVVCTAPVPSALAEFALFDLSTAGPAVADPDSATVELGVRLTVAAPYRADGIAFYRAAGSPIAGARVHLWEGSSLVATGHAGPDAADGWARVGFDDGAQTLHPGTEYVASYTSDDGGYVATDDFFSQSYAPPGSGLRTPADAGVYRYLGDEGDLARPTDVWAHANYWVTVYGEPSTTAPTNGPWALFDAGTPIANPASDDSAEVELGVRFGVAAPPAGDYAVTKVRFYRSHATGMVENRVFVYDESGAVVGRGQLIGEGQASGVVDVHLDAPVKLRPGATYTASYRATIGRYAEYHRGLSVGAEAGPISFPADAGVYRYGRGFPTLTWESTHYYVSPVVTLETGVSIPPPRPPADTTIPAVQITAPSEGATVSAGSPFYVRARLTDQGNVLKLARVLVDGAVRDSVSDPWSGTTVNFPITLSPGPHTIAIRAEDPAGNAGEASIDVTAVAAGYEAYRRAVPASRPRRRPWSP